MTLSMEEKASKIRMTGRRYKELMASLGRNAKGSAVIRENDVSSQSSQGSKPRWNEDGTSSANSLCPQSGDDRLDCQKRRERLKMHSNSNRLPKDKKRKIRISQMDLNISNHNKKVTHSVGDSCKSTTTSFVHYWVPVTLSNLQIEQYCGSLFSNARLLCSSLKDLPVGLSDILDSTKKCCDHPYLVDLSLRTSLIQGIPKPQQLDAEIMLSSKLLLLYKILEEIKGRGLRVLILYQSLRAPGSISTGDILDDIIHQKFGEDCFIRIDREISLCTRKAVLNSFNDKESGKFACLIETRACVSSIELVSIDTVVLFNSDWDPLNDLKALQKINLNSQSDHVKVFRLYSRHTVEEKALLLAMQGTTLDAKESTYHELLRWGASYLFKKLDEFHSLNTPVTYSVISGDSYVEDVLRELSILLPNNTKSNINMHNSPLSTVHQIGGICTRGISLIGEVECPLEETMNKVPRHVFWKNLLEGRMPEWRFFSSHSSRIRKSTQCLDDFFEESTKSATKKCRIDGSFFLYSTSTIKRTRNKNKRDNERYLPEEYSSGKRKSSPVRHDTKNNAVEWYSRDATACSNPSQPNSILTGQRVNLDGPCSMEPLSAVPHAKGHHMPPFPTIQNDLAHGTPGLCSLADAATGTAPLTADSLSPLDSSGQHPMEEVPLSTACLIESDLTAYERESPVISHSSPSLNSESHHPVEASHVTYSETLGSVCAVFKKELERLQKQKNECLKRHEEMKLQTKLACEEEINQARKKCDMLLMNAETTFLKDREIIKSRYDILYAQACLAVALMQQDNLRFTTLLQGNEMDMEVQPAGLANVDPILDPTHVSPSHGSRVLSMNSTSMQFSHSVLGHLTGPVARPDLQLQMTMNQVESKQIHAPAPHLRYMRHSSPITAARFSSPEPRSIFTPVRLMAGSSNIHTQSWSSRARWPLLRN